MYQILTPEIDKLTEFDNHRFVCQLFDDKTNLRAFIAIHRGGLMKPAFGATRLWAYENELAGLRDVLKLSRIMSYKSALAGLPYGGAKAVIILPKNNANRNEHLIAYAQKLNYFSDHFMTGADVGMSNEDVQLMSKYTKNVVGLMNDPVKFTVSGILLSLRVCLQELFGNQSLEGRSFAIQGLGKTGIGILRGIYPEAATIYVSDIDDQKLNYVKDHFPKVKLVQFGEIFKQEVDIFAPCAMSNAINANTISLLRCKGIVGSANSQLETPQIGDTLFKLGILYAPDYIVNAGGLIAVVDEYEHGKNNDEEIMNRVGKIEITLSSVIEKGKKENIATNRVADAMAEKLFNNFV